MENQLKTAIELYEGEKIRLEKLINDCIAESEYLDAHNYSKALKKVNTTLWNLYNLNDKLYSEKKYFEESIATWQKMMESEDDAFTKEYIKDVIERDREQLDRINQNPTGKPDVENENLFDNILRQLLTNKITKLRLILNKAENLILTFNYSGRVLKTTIPFIKQHTRTNALCKSNIDSLKNLGFIYSKNETRLVLTLEGEKEQIYNQIKTILSKIVFEVFYSKTFSQQSFIEFVDKETKR